MEYQKLKKKKFTSEQVLKVIEILKKTPNLHAQEIAVQVPELSARQIKKIRYILNNGSEEHMNKLLSCEYYISGIASGIKLEKKHIKKQAVIQNKRLNIKK